MPESVNKNGFMKFYCYRRFISLHSRITLSTQQHNIKIIVKFVLENRQDETEFYITFFKHALDTN